MPDMIKGSFRKALVGDVEPMMELVAAPSKEGRILPLTRLDLYGRLRDYFVYLDQSDRLQGICGLHICWESLGEIRSLVVGPELRGGGIGSTLVRLCLEEAREMGLKKVFVLTYLPDFFTELGFNPIDKEALPHKIWADCIHCVHFPKCDEVALVQEL